MLFYTIYHSPSLGTSNELLIIQTYIIVIILLIEYNYII